MDSKKKHLSTSLLIGVCLILLCVLGCDLSTGYSNNWRDTIAVSDRYFRLQLLNPDTGETVVIRESPKVYSGVRWSPDGQFIAHPGPSSRNEMDGLIYVTNRFGRGNRIITLWDNEGRLEQTRGMASNPVWSPDGDYIAFTRSFEPDGIPHIHIATSNPSAGLYEVHLSLNYTDPIPYDWTLDGSRILFGSNGLYDGTYPPSGGRGLYLTNVDGTETYQLIEGDLTFSIKGARYSPNGTQIAFIVYTRIGEGLDHYNINSIYIINADGTDLRRVLELGMAGNTYIKIICLTWSSDGTKLAYSASSKPWNGGHIYIVNTDGTNLIHIRAGDSIYFDLDWRPRG